MRNLYYAKLDCMLHNKNRRSAEQNRSEMKTVAQNRTRFRDLLCVCTMCLNGTSIAKVSKSQTASNVKNLRVELQAYICTQNKSKLNISNKPEYYYLKTNHCLMKDATNGWNMDVIKFSQRINFHQQYLGIPAHK